MKLEASGLDNDILFWFKSYQSDRTQLVELSGTHLSYSPITCGVTQGSILGPLLFIVHVNDMSAVVNNKLHLYADDSRILVSGKNKRYIEHFLTEYLNCLIDD